MNLEGSKEIDEDGIKESVERKPGIELDLSVFRRVRRYHHLQKKKKQIDIVQSQSIN